jgi:hypothetical protein
MPPVEKLISYALVIILTGCQGANPPSFLHHVREHAPRSLEASVTQVADNSAIQFGLSSIPEERYTSRHIPLRLTFENTGSLIIRILNYFEPLPIFFSFQLSDSKGTPIAIPGAGKIDFGPGELSYIELGEGEQFSTEVDLDRWIQQELTTGIYTLTATYHNQYGQNCFQGHLKSNSITIVLDDSL